MRITLPAQMGDKLVCAACGKSAVSVSGVGIRREQVGGHYVPAGRTVGGLVVIRSKSANNRRLNYYLSEK
ncbi:hypothetical protein DPMN_079755 [Dreissena polymorpha]|uniref:Uncharacterized protein n=1 Tax=Dreissena polymorpha TaxID=45954 RepID=A0A9D3YSQ5_DREPO|nr:hypothetical protein DPMN_079755 [Dreissena polymorpha]